MRDLIAELSRRGVVLSLEDGNIRFRGPRGAMTTELKKELAKLKEEVVAQLQVDAPPGSIASEPEGPESSARAHHRLSFAQERLLFLERLRPGTCSGLICLGARLTGPVDAEFLRLAIEGLIARHEVLRTRLLSDDQNSGQVVDGDLEIALEEHDLTALSGDAIQVESDRIMATESRTPFDLARPPLLRARLLRYGAESAILLLSSHIAAVDGWSIEILLDELAELYRAAEKDRRPALVELPMTYAEYAEWQRDQALETSHGASFHYWRDRIKRHARHASPTVPRRSPDDRADSLEFEVDADLAASLRKTLREEGATTFSAFLAALQLSLRAWLRDDHPLVGTVVSDRPRVETERMVGNFANNLMLFADLSDRSSLREALASARDEALEAFAHQDLTYERIINELRVDDAELKAPELRSMIVFHARDPMRELELSGIEVEPITLPPAAIMADITLSVFERPETFRIQLAYRGALHVLKTMEALRDSIVRVLGELAARPQRLVSELDLPIAAASASTEVTSDQASPRDAEGAEDALETETERSLAEIFREILTVRRVGAHDNFFDLGGYSIQALSLIQRVEEQWGITLDPGDLMMQSMGQLAVTIDDGSIAAKKPARPGGLLGRVVGSWRRSSRDR